MSKSLGQKLQVKQKLNQLKCCVLVPNFNNAKTTKSVNQSSSFYCDDGIIFYDGCMDSTSDVIAKYLQLKVVDNPIYQIKRVGFKFIPIWELQFAAAIFVSVYFKLNKIIVGLTTQISLSLLIPFLLCASAKTGACVLNQKINVDYSKLLTIEKFKNFYVYNVCSTLFYVFIVITCIVVILLLLKLFGYKPSANESES